MDVVVDGDVVDVDQKQSTAVAQESAVSDRVCLILADGWVMHPFDGGSLDNDTWLLIAPCHLWLFDK